MLSGEKILITGASGLVGMELASGLTGHNEVWGLARYKRREDRQGAINAWSVSRQEVEAAGIMPVAADLMGDLADVPTDFSYLIHLAHTRLGADQLQQAVQINAVGMGRILHHCRAVKAALIMSSGTVYTPPSDVWRQLKEGDPLGGAQPPFHNHTSPASKISLEAVAQYCANEFGVRTVITRAAVVYGPNGGLPTRDLQRVIDGERIPQFGDPLPHSPIHFDDMRDQIEALLDSASTTANIVNWGGDEVVTQREWCELASELSGQTLEVNFVAGAPAGACDPTKRRAITGPCKRAFAPAFSEIHALIKSGHEGAKRQLSISRSNQGKDNPA